MKSSWPKQAVPASHCEKLQVFSGWMIEIARICERPREDGHTELRHAQAMATAQTEFGEPFGSMNARGMRYGQPAFHEISVKHKCVYR